MKKKILLTRTIQDFALKRLRRRYRVEIHTGKIPIPKKVLQSKIRDAEGLICFPYDMITREVIDHAKELKVISTFSVGFDHIDIQYAREKNIRIGYTPNVLTDATADLAFALLLDIAKRVSEGDRIVRDKRRWTKVYGPTEQLGVDLQDKTIGIWGLGRIGSMLAKRAVAFDMKVIYHNTRRLPESKERSLHAKYVTFEKLVKSSDFLSIHVPHTRQTNQLIDMKVFAKMKNTAYLINTARGKIVNERDLVQALKKKIIAGAGLDVFEEEPIDKMSPLARLENVVLTPHIGSATNETRAKMAELVVKNLNLGIQGKRPVFSV